MKRESKLIRQKRIRTKLKRNKERPRISVFRSNKFIYAQIIDDVKEETLVSVSEKELSEKEKINKIEKAKKLGQLLAKKSLAKKIKKVVFDRGHYGYQGRVKSFADGAREGGLEF